MPLTAKVNGKKIVSLDLSDEEWALARASDIRMDCCGSVGHTRTSPLGLRHFYHEKNADCPNRKDEAESDEHRKLKYEIFQICGKLGWKADIEHNTGNWIADVFAEKDGQKVVFEVQLSSQTYEVTVSRTDCYRKENIRCYWLFGQLPNMAKGSKDIDMFEVRLDGNKSICNVNGEIIPLSEFVEKALSNQIIAPDIPAKSVNKKGQDHDSEYSMPGYSIPVKERLDSPFTAVEKARLVSPSITLEGVTPKKLRVDRDFSTTPSINLSEEDKLRANGILKYQPEEMTHVDEDHLAYDSRTWDIIGSYQTMDEAATMRRKAWMYYHCTYIIIDENNYMVIAQEHKDYVHQPGLQAIRGIL